MPNRKWRQKNLMTGNKRLLKRAQKKHANRKHEGLTEYQIRKLEERAAAKRAVATHIFKYFLLCLIVTFLIWGLTFSPLFKVHSIQFEGIDERQYPVFINREELNNYLNSLSADSSVSMVLLSTDKVQSELNSMHGIKSSLVTKIWPDKLAVAIDPNVPVAKKDNQLIDIDGNTLGTWQIGMPNYPEFGCVENAENDCLILLNALNKEPEFNKQIQKITADGRDNIQVLRADGKNIIFGNTNRLTLKLEVLKQIMLQDIGGRKTIDLSSPTDPVAK